jgi:hypothetical protein
MRLHRAFAAYAFLFAVALSANAQSNNPRPTDSATAPSSRPIATIFQSICACGVNSAGNAAPQRPNVLWLIAEDFGVELGCYDAHPAVTPRLDALAADGVRYARFYTTAPVCSASRSAFMTGMYQTTIGAHNHRSHRDDG